MKPRAEAMLGDLFMRRPELRGCEARICEAFETLRACFAGGGKLLVCGNGGSAADAEHIVGELMKGFLLKRPLPANRAEALRRVAPEEGERLAAALQSALPAISLAGHPALSTAFANDVAPDMVFAQQVLGYGRPGDVLWAISCSGMSHNVINAALTARASGMTVLGMTGRGGGRLAAVAGQCISVPETDTFLVQELHQPVYHALCAMLEEEFFGGS